MKRILTIFLAIFLLTGCTAPVEPTIPATQPTISSTTAPSTVPETPTEPSVPPTPNPLEVLLESLTLEEKVGQLFLGARPAEGALSDIQTYHLGGFTLYANDFENQTPESIQATLAIYQETSKVPLIFAVDEEGGTVTRVSRYPAFRSKKFASPRSLYANGGLSDVLKEEAEKCLLLKNLGINVNLSPVCDITTDRNAFMYHRSLGLSPEDTGAVIAAMVQTMGEHQVGSVLKHFPGYGNNTDTHVAMAIDNRSLAELESRDLVPFAAGITADCDAIMVSHTIVSAIDPLFPASLSPAVIDYLRNTMGFQGVIITDDLAMEAISDYYGPGEAAVMAVIAGNDLLCCQQYAVQYRAVLEAVQNGNIPMEMLDAAVMRILCWKQSLGLI